MAKKKNPYKDITQQYLDDARRAFDNRDCRSAQLKLIKAAEAFGKITPIDSPDKASLRKLAQPLREMVGAACMRTNVRVVEEPTEAARIAFELDDKPFAPRVVESEATARRFSILDIEDTPEERERHKQLIEQRRAEYEREQAGTIREERQAAPSPTGRLRTRGGRDGGGGFGCGCRKRY
jgi:hypothetical protein